MTTASPTAEYMALFRAIESAGPRASRLFEDAFAAKCLKGRLGVVAALARQPLLRGLVTLALDRGWPLTRSSGVVRTRLIDDLVAEAAPEMAQVLILGAGFDTRALRLPALAQLPVFEVDHPATQRAKRSRLAREYKAAPNVKFIPVDFEKDDLSAALSGAGFKRDLRTLVLWEGVVAYLEAPTADAAFRQIADLCGAGSTLVFTYVDQRLLDGTLQSPAARRWRSWVARGGEPFILGFAPAELGTYLRARGFDLAGDVTTAEAATRYNARLGRHEPGSEFYRTAWAQRSGNG